MQQLQPLRISAGTLQLEAVLQLPAIPEPRALLIVCHPHPLYGGSMDNNVVAALCEAAVQEGLAALRFNFRGVGRSEGTHGGGEPEAADVSSVLAFAAAQPGGRSLHLSGYSFGARVAAVAASRAGQAPRSLILVSPPLRTMDWSGVAGAALSQLWITGDRDTVSPAAELEAHARTSGPQISSAIVDGADHSWFGYESELRDIAGGFLRWQSGAPA